MADGGVGVPIIREEPYWASPHETGVCRDGKERFSSASSRPVNRPLVPGIARARKALPANGIVPRNTAIHAVGTAPLRPPVLALAA